MAKVKKASSLKKARSAKKKTAQPASNRLEVKNKVAKPAAKKKAVKSMKKTSAWPVIKKKAVVKAPQAVLKTRELRVIIAALKQEIQDLKNELRNVRKRADALAGLGGQRDAAAAKFLKAWDKKAIAALEESLKPKKSKKSRI